MRAVLISIQAEHNANIEKGLKKSELRTRAPKLQTPFKVYTYESGLNGRHKVVNEWICRDITTWLMYMGLPAHLSKVACVSNEYIWDYCAKGHKNIDEMHISDLVIYDEPKGLHHFFKPCGDCDKKGTIRCTEESTYCRAKVITRPPQSWCYVEERSEI